jgi:CIC family chloride channel protein
MSTTENDLQRAADEGRSLPGVVAIALVAGAAIGSLGAIFRVALEHADRLRNATIACAHGEAM